MIGLILATCIAAHDCTWEVIEAKPEWLTVEQCENDVPFTLMELQMRLKPNQTLICDELKEDK